MKRTNYYIYLFFFCLSLILNGYCMENGTTLSLLNGTSSSSTTSTTTTTPLPGAVTSQGPPQAAAQIAQPRDDGSIPLSGLTFDSQTAFDQMTMLRPPPMFTTRGKYGPINSMAASMLRPAVVPLYPRNPSGSSPSPSPSSSTSIQSQQPMATSSSSSSSIPINTHQFHLRGFQAATPEIIRGTPMRMPPSPPGVYPAPPYGSSSNLSPIYYTPPRPHLINPFSSYSNDMLAGGSHPESLAVLPPPGFQIPKNTSGHIQLQKNIAEHQHLTQVTKSAHLMKQQQQHLQQQSTSANTNVKSFLPALPQHVPASLMSPFLQSTNGNHPNSNRPTPIHPGFPAVQNHGSYHHHHHPGQLYPLHPLRGPPKDMIKFSIDDHVPTASESKMWRIKAPAELANSFLKDQMTSASEISPATTITTTTTTRPTTTRKRVLETVNVKMNRSTTTLTRKKATLKDILIEDCPGADEFGYCASPPRYPSHQVGIILSKCSETMKSIYAPLPEGIESDGVFYENETNIEKTKSKWNWNHNSKHTPLCDSESRRIEPGYGRDANDGRWYVIIQSVASSVTQRVLVDVCRDAGHSCSGLSGTKCAPNQSTLQLSNHHPSGTFRTPSKTSICKQKFSYDRLMTWDPDRPEECPKIRVFRFPTACVCHLPIY